MVLRAGPGENDLISSPQEVADLFGKSFAERSSSRSYTNVFRDIRERTALLDFSPPRGSDFAYNHLFTLTEFRDALASCKEGLHVQTTSLVLCFATYILQRYPSF